MSCYNFQKEEKHFPFGAEGPCASGGRSRGPSRRTQQFLAASSPRHRHHLPATNAAQSPCHPRLFQPSTKLHNNAELYNNLWRRCITEHSSTRGIFSPVGPPVREIPRHCLQQRTAYSPASFPCGRLERHKQLALNLPQGKVCDGQATEGELVSIAAGSIANLCHEQYLTGEPCKELVGAADSRFCQPRCEVRRLGTQTHFEGGKRGETVT